jgi:group I intron endonuclease
MKMSEAKTGDKHPMYGKTHSTETLAKMSESQRKIDRTGENNPMFGKTHSAYTRALLNKKVFVYSLDPESKMTILYKEFSSCAEAALYFDCTTRSISNYLDKDKLYKKEWILSSTMKE